MYLVPDFGGISGTFITPPGYKPIGAVSVWCAQRVYISAGGLVMFLHRLLNRDGALGIMSNEWRAGCHVSQGTIDLILWRNTFCDVHKRLSRHQDESPRWLVDIDDQHHHDRYRDSQGHRAHLQSGLRQS